MHLTSLIFLLSFTLSFSGIAEARSQFTLPAPLYTLTVNTTPENTTVRIMNIRPVYHDGIKLRSGSYRLEISAKGYQLKKQVIYLTNQDRILHITLEKDESVVQASIETPVEIPSPPAIPEQQAHELPINSNREPVISLLPDTDSGEEEIYSEDNTIPIYTMSRGFRRFLGHANELYGISFNDPKFIPYCRHYAKLAVHQAKRRINSGCIEEISLINNDTAKQWSLDNKPQKKWCRTVSSHATAKESIYREKSLQSCIQNQRRIPGS